MVRPISGSPSRRVYWHRELPPESALVGPEHVVEAQTPRTPFRFMNRDAAWEACYGALADLAERRIIQELDRMGGWCARVIDEDVHSKADEATGEYWLAGRFSYIQYDAAEEVAPPMTASAAAGGIISSSARRRPAIRSR